MSDLVEFLTARLDEDEAAARAWLPIGNPDAAAREHIARHDPARVLREVAAKRAILAGHSTVTGWNWPDQSDGSVQMDYVEALRRTLRHLAAVYSDHPDYDEAWRP
jgi:hypothetical protein